MNKTVPRLLFRRPPAVRLGWLCLPALLWWAEASQAQTDVANQPAAQALRLINLPVDKMAAILGDLLGDRLKATENAAGPRSLWVFLAGPGRQVELVFDRQQNEVTLRGPLGLVEQLRRLIVTVDSAPASPERLTRIVRLHRANPGQVMRIIEAYRGGPRDAQTPPANNPAPRPRDTSRLGIPRWAWPLAGILPAGSSPKAIYRCQSPDNRATPPPPGAGMPPPGAPAGPPSPRPDEKGPPQPIGPRLPAIDSDLEVETLPDLDAIILRGRPRDVEELRRIIEEIERLSAETQPQIDILYLTHVSSEALAAIIKQVDPDLTGGRQGRASAVALVKPNALLLIGWGEAAASIKELVHKLDQPVAAETQFRVFRLRNAAAATAQTTIQNLYTKQTGLGPQVKVIADIRTNSLIVQAAPRDLEEVGALVERLDQTQGEAVRQVRMFKLRNSLAVDVASVLQAAVGAAKTGAATQKNAALELLSVDAKGRKLLRAGLLDDVQITPDPRTNSLVIAGPAESMELLDALVKQLDTPASVAQIKVFRIVNGDATAMVAMLHSLLFSRTTGAGAMPSAPLVGAEGETTLVPVRFSVDLRTNSIIATGSQSDLAIIEALLLRLDEDKGSPRKNAVFRLKNNRTQDVARSVNEFLRSEKQVQQTAPGVINPFQQIESEVVVVPEVVSNSLIVSATPRFFEDIMDLVKKLDAEPPQVVIQVLIAQVTLSNQDEFGIELGLQDSILFDRSLLGNLVTTTTTSQTSTSSGVVTQTQQNIIGATNQPGYNFNNQTLGNSGGTQALANPSQVGTQGLSSFGLGRTNSTLGYGGLVLSASSESVSALIRALQQTSRLEVLSRPQVMTLDNQPAFVQVGQRVPRITGSTLTQVGQQNNIVLENVGLILGVTPRISPDGRVVMEVDAEKSQLGNIADGIPVTTSGGVVINSPTIDLATAQTTCSAIDGETIVIGGLITKSTSTINRRVPYLSDVPLLGLLFRYDSHDKERTEMLIILTPHIVKNPEDAERIRQMEESRMNWCLCDVNQIHGPAGFSAKPEQAAAVVYPDANPRGVVIPPPLQLNGPPTGPQPGGPPPGQDGRPEPVPPGPEMPPRN
jgi:type II secretion system protein D